MSSKKVLVTGAAGFIASHLAERLVDLGHEVYGIDNFSPYYDRSLKELNVADIQSKGVHFIEADLVTSDLVSILPKDIDIVFHLAAQPGIASNVSFDDYLSNNVIATQKLLNYAQTSKNLDLFINIATSSIYGKFAISDEKAIPQPTSYYGVTKLAAEQLALSYFRDKNMPVCSARLFSVYGERERPEKMYTKLIKSIVEGKEFPLFEGSELHRRSYTYVGDIIDGLILMMQKKDKVLGEVFNLGTPEVISTGEGIKIIEEILGKKAQLKTYPKRAGDQQETKAVIQKAQNILGYNPKISAKVGLKKQVDWYLAKFVKKTIL